MIKDNTQSALKIFTKPIAKFNQITQETLMNMKRIMKLLKKIIDKYEKMDSIAIWIIIYYNILLIYISVNLVLNMAICYIPIQSIFCAQKIITFQIYGVLGFWGDRKSVV